jgi:hypothetical protein
MKKPNKEVYAVTQVSSEIITFPGAGVGEIQGEELPK